MKIKNLKHDAYSDGVLHYGKMTIVYGAGNKKIGETFEPEGKLFFSVMSARDSDNITANAFGYTIDKKLKTHYCPQLKTSHKVKVDEEIFDIKSLDSDRRNSYLYLQRAGV
ncbi:MAG TPA: phage head closure protein [Oscillospiraceae bacterium]|nr:phage head closure protein [Oscillospiraceae bacterium]